MSQAYGRDVLYPEESYAIQGAAYEVYSDKGHGFLEPVYQECMEIELEMREIPFKAQVGCPLSYKGRPLAQTYRPDFVCYDRIVVELKAVKAILPDHEAQVLNYLKAAKLRLGLLVNFGHFPGVQIKRLVL
jgi:GxxExxY protein